MLVCVFVCVSRLPGDALKCTQHSTTQLHHKGGFISFDLVQKQRKAAHAESSDLEDRDGGPSSRAPNGTLSAEKINSSVTLASVLFLTKSIGKAEPR